MLVDDDAGFRRRTREVLAEEFPFASFGEAGSAVEALIQAARAPWDVAILDIRIPGRSGLALLPELGARHPGIAVVVASMLPEELYAAAAIDGGAAAFVPKGRVASDLVGVVRGLLRGG